MRFVKHALLFFTIFVVATVQAQITADRVVARVNGKPIIGRDYYKRMEVQPGLGSVGPNRTFIPIYPGYLTLRWLIEEELLVQLADRKGLAPSDVQIDTELKSRLEENAAQVREMLNFGFDENDLRRRILVDLSEFNILTEGVTITDFEVEKHYADNLLRYTLPKRYQLRMISVSGDEAKKAVDDALAAGTAFEEVARKYSIEISKYVGGSIGVVPEDEMTPSTRTIIANTNKGRTTEWFTQGETHGIFLLEDVFDQEVLPLDDKLTKAIRETQMRARGQAKNNLPKMMADFRKTAELEFDEFPFAEDLRRHFSVGG